MADCEETLRELEAFLDGELTADDLSLVRSHIDGCMDCLQAYDFYAELRVVIKQKCREQEVPPGLLDRVKSCFGDDAAEALERPPQGPSPPPPDAAGRSPRRLRRGACRDRGYDRRMVLAAQVWHFWIGVVITISAILLVVALAIGYVVKVERPQFPPNPDR